MRRPLTRRLVFAFVAGLLFSWGFRVGRAVRRGEGPALLARLTGKGAPTPSPALVREPQAEAAPTEIATGDPNAGPNAAVDPGGGPGGSPGDGGTAEDAKLATVASIAGEVVDESGQPIADAEISLVREELSPPGGLVAGPSPLANAPKVEHAGELGLMRGPVPFPPLAEPLDPTVGGDPTKPVAAGVTTARPKPAMARATTDAAGRFRLPEVPPGHALVVASHPAFVEARSAPLVLAAGEGPNVRLTLHKPVTARGRVVDEKDQPVAGAELWVLGALAGTTDKEGQFELKKLPGPIDVEVRARGRVPIKRRIDPAGGEQKVAVGDAEAQIAGVVVDDRGLPVPGARLTVESRDGQRQIAVSDGVGEFSVPAAGQPPYVVVATHREFLRATANDVVAGDSVRLELGTGGVVEGEVREEHGSGPPNGTRLTVEDATGDRHSGSLDNVGRFRVPGCGPGPAKLSVEAPGFLPVHANIEVPQARAPGDIVLRDLRVTMHEAGTIVGDVRDRYGVPVVGAEVEGGGVRGRTDGSGRFSLAPVPAGRRVDVTVRAPAGEISDGVLVERGRAAALDLRFP